MLSLFKKKSKNLPPNQDILNRVYQDGKKRVPIFSTHFGGIIFKEKNGDKPVYKLLDIRKDKTENEAVMYVFEQFTIADSKENFDAFFKYEYSQELYEDQYIKYSTYEELAKSLGTPERDESFIIQHDQYARSEGKTVKLKNVDYWQDVLQKTTFNERTLSNLSSIDNLEDNEAFRVLKLYWGYGRETKSEKLYDCLNLQELAIWEENASYLNSNIINFQSLNVLSLNTVSGVDVTTLQKLHRLKHLVSLSLNGVSVIHDNTPQTFTLPQKLHELSHLKYLSLVDNALTDFAEIAKLKHLKTLEIAHNQFSTLEGIENLTELEALDISHNKFETLPNGIRQLSKLKSLIIGANALAEIPNWIGELTNLTKLVIHDTDIDTLPESIGNLKHLNELYIWNNPFTNLPKCLNNFTEDVVQLEYKKQALYDDHAAKQLSEFQEGVCLFENDLNFKLLVINELMYVQETLKPQFDLYEFAESYTEREIDIEKEGYEPLPEALEYFKQLEIPKSLLLDIEDLSADGGDEVYGNIYRFWNGYTDEFDITSVEDVTHLPRLKKMNTLFLNTDLIHELESKGIKVDDY